MVVLSCFTLFWHGGAAAQLNPDAWPKNTGAPINSSPVLGDLDGDGMLEIIVGSDNNKVYAWKPDGTLMPGWPVTTGDAVRSSPALADIDSDGRLDVIVGSYDNKVYIWNFNGSLLPGWPAVTGSVVYSSPAVGDIDGDQLPEVVVGSFDNKVYAWNADGTLLRGWPKPTGLFVYSSPALADIDGDGLVEVVVGTDNNRVFAWNGDGSDVEGWPTATEHVVPSSPAIGDVDNDGGLEVVVGSWDKVFMWNSQGETKKGWPVQAGHQIPSSPALADLNNDGLLEIIVGCKDGKLYVWDARGRVLPGWPAVTDAEIAASPAIADLDGDGRLEIVIGSKDSKVYIWDAEGRLFPNWPKTTSDSIASSPAIADVNRDGTLEVVIGSKDGNVYIWSFPRTGSFTPKVAWQNFHGDPSHSGLYGFQTTVSYIAQSPQIIPTRPAEGMQAPEIRTMPDQPLELRPPDQPIGVTPIVPRTIADGYVNDLLVADYDETSLTLTWTAPPGTRTAQTVYEVRYASQPITEETWEKATPHAAAFRPAPAGAREVQKLEKLALPGQRLPDTLYVALKVREGQKSFSLSNVVRVERLDITPPARIQGLKVVELNETLLELSWQTTGDDGMLGAATSYDIRYAESPLTELTWARAAQVENEPAPLPAGTEQKFQFQKPWSERDIFFGIKAIDDALNISELSEMVVLSPRDEIPPARIVDLHVTSISGNTVTVAWTAPGNNLNVGKAQRYDLRYSEYPITESNWIAARPSENPPEPENSGTPQTYTLQGIPIGAVGYVGIKTVDSSGNTSALSNVVETAKGDSVPPTAVTDLKIDQIGKDWARVSWTASGDDGQKGNAAAYVLRYGGNLQVVKSWTTAMDVQQLPQPSSVGTTETATVTGLHENSTYYLGLRVLDEQGNASETSNILRVKTLGRSSPEAVADLTIEDLKLGSVTLNWTAPKDFGEETSRVSGYDIRYATSEITEGSWETATRVKVALEPVDPGKLEAFTVKGAPQDTAYYVALKSYDALGNVSALSNVIQVPQFDKVAPAPIIDLLVEETGIDWARMTWTAPGDDQQAGRADSYQIRVAPNLKLLQQWDQATEIPTTGGPTALVPSSAGAKEVFTLADLKSKTTFYVAVRALDAFGNLAELSNIVRIQTKDPVPPEAITDLRMSNIREDSVVLEWTATGDDGAEGQAKAYDIRYAREPLSSANWESAAIVPLVPSPSRAGTADKVTVSELEPGTMYYFGVVAIDSSGNPSPLSNVVDALTTDTVPPAPITTLRAEKVNDDSVVLTWLSPGNDQYRDAPERYEIRYREGQKVLLTEESWAKSPQAPEPPTPSGKGIEERFVLSGLRNETIYTIGVKVMDEYGNISTISNVVQVYTMSDVVKDLKILDSSGNSVTLTWTTPGGEISDDQRLYDIRYATTPLTEENWNNAALAEKATRQDLAVKEPAQPEKVQLTNLSPHEQLFFAIRVLRPGAEKRLAGLSNVVELKRLDILPPGKIADLQVADGGEKRGMQSLKLRWKSPGDNEFEGTATKYEIRYGVVPPTTDNWETLTSVADMPAPQTAGTSQQATVEVLPGEDTLYFAIRTYDEALNLSELSNIAQWSPEDHTPPAAITDLTVMQVSGGDVTLSWTAPGDNGDRGMAMLYDLRYSTAEKDVKKWDQAVVASGEPLPEIAGTRQECMITELQQDAMYYVAITTTDDAGNTSALSNIVTVRTADAIPPAPVADLRIGKSGGDWAELIWTASGDDRNSGRATAYSIRYAAAPEELTEWTNAYELTGAPAPNDPGKQEKFTAQNLRSNTRYYFGVRVLDNNGNISEVSNIAEMMTGDAESSAPIQNLTFVGGTDTTVALSWTAPQDRGPSPRIAQYDIRISEKREELEQWNRAKKVKHAIVPGDPGKLESVMVDQLAPNKRYYVAVKAIDQLGNVSEISNIAEADTTDTIPPQPVTDLTAQAMAKDAVKVSWSVNEDDSAHDKPAVYELRYSLLPIDETNWEAVQLEVPADKTALQPSAAGIRMEYTVAGLAENTRYYFAVRAIDAYGNLSPLSNVGMTRTSDVTPPQGVTDLQAMFPTPNSIMLSWTSPTDVVTGPAAGEQPSDDTRIGGYDIRYATIPPEKGSFDEQAWETAEKVILPPTPQSPGVVEEFVVSNLEADKTYYFAVRAIDPQGNVSILSNTAVETTLPLEVASRAVTQPSEANYGWDVVQGRGSGDIRKDNLGVINVTQTGSRGTLPGTPITISYPQSGRTMSVRQGELTFQVKSTQRFTLYVAVRDVNGEQYELCYTTDFGIGAETRPQKRIENHLFFPITFPLDAALLDNQWHEIHLNLAHDLLEGTGQMYEETLRLTLRGNDLAFRGMTMHGAVATRIDDFEAQRDPLRSGWNIHFGSGMVQVLKEAVLTKIEVTPRAPQENTFLFVKADDARGIVLTYPKEISGQLSNKPFFLANIKPLGNFKLILKVSTKDQREYYLAYVPETMLQQTGLSGNYIYLPLQLGLAQGEGLSADWLVMQANIEQDLRNQGLEYAYTSWISFHGEEFSLDNVRFSTEILETVLE